jgi:hypothetical protein
LQVALYYFRHIIFRNLAVEYSLGLDEDRGTLLAESMTAGGFDADFQTKMCYFFFKALSYLLRAGTPRPAANEYLAMSVGRYSGFPLSHVSVLRNDRR